MAAVSSLNLTSSFFGSLPCPSRFRPHSRRTGVPNSGNNNSIRRRGTRASVGGARSGVWRDARARLWCSSLSSTTNSSASASTPPSSPDNNKEEQAEEADDEEEDGQQQQTKDLLMQPSPEPPADAATEGEKKQKKKGELARRIVFGLAVGIVGGFGAFRGGLVFCATVSLISLQCAREYHQIVIQKGRGRGFKGYPPFLQKTLLVTCLFCVVGTHIGIKSGIFEVGVFWLLSQLLIVRASRKVKLGQPKRNLARLSQIASLVFGLVYCGYLPSFWARLRNISIPLSNDVPSWLASTGIVVDGGWTTGLAATVTSLLCVVSADVGAYTFGRLFGSTPLSPVSPKKTVEGAYGGMISAVLCAVGVRAALGAPVHLWASICVGLICFVGGILGDLIESSLKREVNIKDSGDVLPGHGGLLDRFDSYIFTGALCYFFWYWYTWLSKGAFTLSALLPPGTAVLFPYVT